MSKQYVSNSQIRIVRCILTLFSDRYFQNQVKQKVYTNFSTIPAYIYLCGLAPTTTYYYTLEIVREFSSRYSVYEYTVTSSGSFITGLDGDMVVETKPEWENNNCSTYSVRVMWDFVLSQILVPDAECEMRWEYSFDDGEFIEVPNEAKSTRTITIREEITPDKETENSGEPVYTEHEEEAEHIELIFDDLSGDKKFTVRGTLIKNNAPNEDYGLVLDVLNWEEFIG